MQVFLFILILSGALSAADWPQWLGPERDAVWREDGILDAFPKEGPKLRWRAPLGGGYSGPAVAQGRVFVMDRIAELIDPAKAKVLHKGQPPRNENFLRKLLPGQERLLCLDEATGRVLWTQQWDCPYTTVATYAIGPRATPTVDGDRVYALGAEGHLFCFAAKDGAIVWQKISRKLTIWKSLSGYGSASVSGWRPFDLCGGRRRHHVCGVRQTHGQGTVARAHGAATGVLPAGHPHLRRSSAVDHLA